MNRIAIDNRSSEITVHDCEKIADVLEKLLGSVPKTRLVTSILVDGIRLSKFPDPFILTRGKDKVFEIEIHTSEKHVWKESGYDMAYCQIERLKQSLCSVCEKMALEGFGAHQSTFEHYLDALELFMESLGFLKAGKELNFKLMQVEERNLEVMERQLHQIFCDLQKGARDSDLETILEKCDFELTPMLTFWDIALGRLKEV